MIPEIVLDALENGTLCTCKQHALVVNSYGWHTWEYVGHRRYCEGALKVSVLLNEKRLKNGKVRPK